MYQAQGRYADAEPLHKRALSIRENTLDPEHPDVAQSLRRAVQAVLSRNAKQRMAESLDAAIRTMRR